MRLLKDSRTLNLLISVIIISSFSYLTFERNKVWQDPVSLWTDVITKAPENARAYNNLGRAYGSQRRHLDASAEFKKALEILPNYALAHLNLAVSYSNLGMPAQAEFHYRKAIEYYPDLAAAYYNYGLFLYVNGRLDEAEKAFVKYTEFSPNGSFASAVNRMLGSIRARKG